MGKKSKAQERQPSRDRVVDDSAFRIQRSAFRPTAKRRFAQNFLKDDRIAERIVAEVSPREDETIIEIGPGGGALTSRLLDKSGRVVAIELDRELIAPLQQQFGTRSNFELTEADALHSDFCTLISPASTARVVANLPYNISTAILQRLIEQRRCISEMILMLQREVAERITAPAGSSERGFLSVLVEAYCESEQLFDVPPAAFRPVPKVWSSVIRVGVRPQIAADVKNETLLWQIVSAGFAQRRKTILNNLRHSPEPLRGKIEKAGGAQLVLESALVDAQRRAESLGIDDWARLANAMEQNM